MAARFWFLTFLEEFGLYWFCECYVLMRGILFREAVVISVKNVSGFVSIDKDNNWVCTDGKNRRTECLPNHVSYFSYLVLSYFLPSIMPCVLMFFVALLLETCKKILFCSIIFSFLDCRPSLDFKNFAYLTKFTIGYRLRLLCLVRGVGKGY